MNQYGIVERDTLKVIDIAFESALDNYPIETHHRILMDEQLLAKGNIDILNTRMNEGNVELFIDETKYATSSAMNGVRRNRDIALSLTDWMVGTDSPLSEEKIQEIKTYRQQLRDLTSSGLHPYEIVIPEHPMVKFPWKEGVIDPN